MLLRCLLGVVANFGFGSSLQALRAETMVDGLPRASTFCFTALDPDNRFRFPPVSLFSGTCLTFWDRRGVWENLFDIEFVAAKVGSWVSIWWCLLVGVSKITIRRFAASHGYPDRHRNPIRRAIGGIRPEIGDDTAFDV